MEHRTKAEPSDHPRRPGSPWAAAFTPMTLMAVIVILVSFVVIPNRKEQEADLVPFYGTGSMHIRVNEWGDTMLSIDAIATVHERVKSIVLHYQRTIVSSELLPLTQRLIEASVQIDGKSVPLRIADRAEYDELTIPWNLTDGNHHIKITTTQTGLASSRHGKCHLWIDIPILPCLALPHKDIRLIDSKGRLLPASAELFEASNPDKLDRVVPLDGKPSIYRYYGDSNKLMHVTWNGNLKERVPPSNQPPASAIPIKMTLAVSLSIAVLLGYLFQLCRLWMLSRRKQPLDGDLPDMPASMCSLALEPEQYSMAAAAGLTQLVQLEHITIDESNDAPTVCISHWPIDDVNYTDTFVLSRSVKPVPVQSNEPQLCRLHYTTAAITAMDIHNKSSRWLHRPEMTIWPLVFNIVCSITAVVLARQAYGLPSEAATYLGTTTRSFYFIMAAYILGIGPQIPRLKNAALWSLIPAGVSLLMLIDINSGESAVRALPMMLAALCIASTMLVHEPNRVVLKIAASLKEYQARMRSLTQEQRIEHLNQHRDERVLAAILEVCPTEFSENWLFNTLYRRIRHEEDIEKHRAK